MCLLTAELAMPRSFAAARRDFSLTASANSISLQRKRDDIPKISPVAVLPETKVLPLLN